AQARAVAREQAVAEQQIVQVPPRPQETLSPPEPPLPIPESPTAPAPSVELARVIVPTAPAVPGEKLVTLPSARRLLPTGAVEINARQMSVSPDRKIAIAEGDVEVIFENAVLTADHMTLFTDTNDVYAEGRVRLEDGAQVSRGEMVHYNFNTKKGRFLQGTVSTPPWYQHGRSVEHIAEGVYAVTPGYITSCDHEPPHFRFFGRRATVFAEDKLARMRNVALFVEQVPFLYLPWLSVADRQSPFFIIPGKDKRWGPFALSGYRYELPGGDIEQKGSLRWDWRRYFRWGFGVDHQLQSPQVGKGLLKLYYQPHMNGTRKVEELPKGAKFDRYRVLWRHTWQPKPDTTVVTDFQKFSDIDFRKELLFREEYVNDDAPESFISLVKNTPDFTLTGVLRKRVNRFQSVTEAFPELAVNSVGKQIGDTKFYSDAGLTFANLQTQTAHSEEDTDVVRVGWNQDLTYALNWFRPVQLSPRAGIRETYYTKDKQGGVERPDGKRDVISGQFVSGLDASLKLFRLFPVVTNALGLNINQLRHVVTPTIDYDYVRRPTVLNTLLCFGSAAAVKNEMKIGIENKLQTKRGPSKVELRSVDIARFLISVPYTFRGHQKKEGGELGDWSFDMELYPWPWLRLESDWSYPSHFIKGSRDERLTSWNLDLVIAGDRNRGKTSQAAKTAAAGQSANSFQSYQPGPLGGVGLLMPEGQWYLGLGHRYSYNGKTEGVIQFDWRLSQKWEIGTYHRMIWKEVAAGGFKRFNNVREYQYRLRRDLHDWLAELVYRVDREFGEELFFTMTLKAYPQIPIEMEESYHQPKVGSQYSPFSPVPLQ
ncbi:MAG: putative LPS assembly protein LptD, partial [Candidatus Omnitrophota bacterium]|nr:putative LPS assembly protein LptD [Candidatus Omnitrophota bacterium]